MTKDRRAGSPPGLGTSLKTGELPEAIACPFCGSDDSEQFSVFGSSLSLSQYYCNACRTVFEAFKWRER
jgi:rubredoxin